MFKKRRYENAKEQGGRCLSGALHAKESRQQRGAGVFAAVNRCLGCPCVCQVKGRSKAASQRIDLRDIRIRIFSRAILSRLHRQVARAVSASCVRVIVVRAGSREVRALILDDLLKYIVQDGFGIVGVLHILRDSQNVTTLANVVLDVLVAALVRELGHLNFL